MKRDEQDRIFCEDCDTVPGMNKSMSNPFGIGNDGPYYSMECKCKETESFRSQYIAISKWESDAYKKGWKNEP